MKNRFVVVCEHNPSHNKFNGKVTLFAQFGRFPHPEDGDAIAYEGSPYDFPTSDRDVGECDEEDCFGATTAFATQC